MKINYTKKEKAKIKQHLKQLSSEAEWIGEDGMATCMSSTRQGAFLKFKRIMRDSIGEDEARELKLEDVGIGFFHLATELTGVKREHLDGADWYIDTSAEGKNPYEVWVLYN